MKSRLIATTLLFLTACAGHSTHPPQPEATPPPTSEERPFVKASEPGQIPAAPELVELDHKYFKVFYDPSIRLARYVTYTATKEDLCKTGGDRDKSKFHPDSQLVDQSIPFVHPKEYVRSGYDQGHLAPAGDFSRSQKATDETFIMSNMAPQKPKLNRIAWKAMEAKVRKWGIGEKKITVITGPILDDQNSNLKSGLVVPPRFFKIVIDETAPRKAIGFIYKQTDAKAALLPDRVAKVSEIEAEIRRNFDLNAPDSNVGDWVEGRCGR